MSDILILIVTNEDFSESTASTGENKSGHIAAAENEGILFLDSK